MRMHFAWVPARCGLRPAGKGDFSIVNSSWELFTMGHNTMILFAGWVSGVQATGTAHVATSIAILSKFYTIINFPGA